MFEQFKPRLPDHFRDARTVFLGNIDPVLQLDVLEQVRRPKLVVCDTMNFWIDGNREALLEVIGRVHILMVNDAEAFVDEEFDEKTQRVLRMINDQETAERDNEEIEDLIDRSQ